MKTLSIIIPTYNMATLLPRCLKSLMDASYAEAIEAIVVNDGSKDNSLQVAREWESRYPESIVVIDKTNGNYGSTINAALPVAHGKYVKILDSDDWFDTHQLDEVLLQLLHADSDMIVTHFTQLEPGAQHEVVRYNTMGREPYTYGKKYNLDDILPDGYIRYFLMHAIMWRTDLLREIGYRQTEGISYTDTEWCCYPSFFAKTVVFYDINLYQYNMDRPGQTMDPKVIVKCGNQLQILTDAMLSFYEAHRSSLTDSRAIWMKKYFENRIRMIYKLYLLDIRRADFDADAFQEVDNRYWTMCGTLQLHPRLYADNKLNRIEYISYWHQHHHRWPIWLENVNGILDRVMKWMYIRIFRR